MVGIVEEKWIDKIFSISASSTDGGFRLEIRRGGSEEEENE